MRSLFKSLRIFRRISVSNTQPNWDKDNVRDQHSDRFVYQVYKYVGSEVRKELEEVYYKNIASAAVFEDSILAEANAVKVERSRSGVEKSQIM